MAAELFQRIPTGASEQPIESSPSPSVGLVPPSGVAIPHSVVNTPSLPLTGSFTATARAGMSPVLNQSTSSANAVLSSTPLVSATPLVSTAPSVATKLIKV